MRVRQCAVVGAALVAMWAGGAGIASATDGTSPVDTGSGCEAPVLTTDDGELADALTEAEGTDEGGYEGDPVSPEPCDSDVTVEVVPAGDCKDPETFTFVVNAKGLEAGVTYTLLLGSPDIDFTYPDGQPIFLEDITADQGGKIVNYTFTETEGDDFNAPNTGLDFGYALAQDFDTHWASLVGGGEAELEACKTEPTVPTTPAEPTQPATPTAAPTTVAPVVVTHPAAAQPAVLANTGTPVTAAALLGGGLLVAGAGVLVATRRRAS